MDNVSLRLEDALIMVVCGIRVRLNRLGDPVALLLETNESSVPENVTRIGRVADNDLSLVQVALQREKKQRVDDTCELPSILAPKSLKGKLRVREIADVVVGTCSAVSGAMLPFLSSAEYLSDLQGLVDRTRVVIDRSAKGGGSEVIPLKQFLGFDCTVKI